MLDTLAIRKNAPIIKVPDEKGGKTMQSINEKLVYSLWDVNHRMRSLHDGKASQGRILVILHERGGDDPEGADGTSSYSARFRQ